MVSPLHTTPTYSHIHPSVRQHKLESSVTRFGEISPLWQNINIFWQFLRVYLVFGILLNLLGQILNAIGQNFIDVNGQK